MSKNILLQKEINNILWQACDAFRDVTNANYYKDYLLVMLFIKYLSDVWQNHYDEYEKKYNGNKEQIERRMDREKIVLPKQSNFYYLHNRREALNLGELVNIGLEKIELANQDKLLKVFRNIDFNSASKLGETRERNRRIKRLLESLANPKLDFKPAKMGALNVIGNAYEYLIGKFSRCANKKMDEFYTPTEISILLSKLVAPKMGERICDPACGTGSLLLKCGNEVKGSDYSLYGQECTENTWALCKMNLLLHHVTRAQVERGNTLLNPMLVENSKLMKFDVVVASLPFALDNWGAEESEREEKYFNRWHRGVPPKSKGGFAFISHMIETTTTRTGRVAVVVPHGVLFRGGSEARIRRALIEENLLDAVIGLPENLFFSTSIPTVILIFRRDRKEKTSVLFIDASREYENEKSQNKLRVSVEVKKILEIYQARIVLDKYSNLATHKEIIENGFNLNISCYVDIFEKNHNMIDLKILQREMKALDEDLLNVQKEVDKSIKELWV